LVSLTLSAFLYFTKDIYMRVTESVVLSTVSNINPPPYTFNYQNFSIMFSLMNPFTYQMFRDESVYRVEFLNDRIFQGINGGNRLMNIESCRNHTEFIGYSPDELDPYYCMTKDESFVMQGTTTSLDFRYLKIKVYPCINGTDTGVVCKPQEVIDSLLTGCSMYYNFIDTIFNPNDYDSPVSHYVNSYFTTVGKDYFKPIKAIQQKVSIISDIGFLFSSTTVQNTYQNFIIQEFMDLRKNPGGEFIEIISFWNVTEEVINRYYKRIQDVLAETGGIINLLFMLTKMLYQSYSKAIFLKETYSSINSKSNSGNLGGINKKLENNLIPSDKYNINTGNLSSTFNRIKFQGNCILKEDNTGLMMKESSLDFNYLSYRNFIAKYKTFLDPLFLLKFYVEFNLLKETMLNRKEIELLGVLSMEKSVRLGVINNIGKTNPPLKQFISSIKPEVITQKNLGAILEYVVKATEKDNA